MATFTIPNTFQGETPAVANEVNANFEAVKTYSIAVQNELNTINEAIADLDKKPVREVFAIYPSISSKTPTGAYPLWTGETITNARSLFPDFWSECLKRKTAGTIKTVASSAAYDEIVDDYGQCSSFFIDELNGHIRLPMLTRFISSISAVGDFGKLDKAGLPNIEGNVDGGRVNATTVTGAFSNNGSGWGRFDGGADQDTNFGNSSFSASSSNEIYGSSDTVQPESISLCWFIQVATNTADISEMNTDVIAEQLNQALLDLQAEYDRLKLLLDDYVANTSIPQVDSYLLNNIYPILTSEVGRAETAAQTAINNASKTAADKTAVGAYVTEVEALAVDIEEYKDSTLAAAALASADADSTSADRTAVEADKGLTLSYKNSAQQYAQESATAAGESENSATNAASSENEATAQAELALKYANGTITEYPDGSSKYWSEQAQRDVQADWNQTDSTEPSFIQNKPDISDVESLTSDVAELQAQLSLKANSSDVVNLTDNQTITGLKSVPTPTADEHISNKGSVGIKAYTSTVPFSLNDVVLNVEDGEVKLYKSLIANNTSALTTEDWEEVSLGGGSSYQLFSQVPMTTALDADIPELSNALLHQLDGSSLPSTGIYSEAFRIAGLLKAKGVEEFSATEEEWQASVSSLGFCDSYVVTDTYLRLPKKFDTKRKLIKKSPTSMLPSWYKIFEETQRDGTVKYWCEQGGFATSTTDADQTTYIHVEYLDTNYTLLNTMCSTSTATLYNISHIGFQTKTTSSFVSRLSSELSREWTAQGYCNAPDDYIPTPTYEYVVLGTKAEQVETVIETNQIVTDLGNKLDKDIANASVRIETIADEWSSGTEWYIIYKRPQADGTVKYWCEQGGMIQASPNAWSTVMLHVPQVNNQYLCMSNSYDFLSIDYFSVGGAVGQATPTSFTIGNAWNYDVVFNWTAEGYCNAPTTEIN